VEARRQSVLLRALFGCAAVCTTMMMVCGPCSAALTLPDGRTWEMVSPLDKNGGEINGIDGSVPDEGLPEGGIVQAGQDGNLITYLSLLAFPGSNGEEPMGAPIASQYLSRRNSSGWLTEDITTPVNSGTYPPAGKGAPYDAFSPDLSRGLMLNGSPPPVENPVPVGAPPRYINYYIRDNGTGGLEPLLTSLPSEGPSEFFAELFGNTPDLSHIVIGTRASLSSEATRQNEGNLYEWTSGQFLPVNVPPEAGHPGETTSGGALLGMGFNENHTISNDGKRVFWSQPGTELLFVRSGLGTEHPITIQIDAARGGVGPGGRGEFKTASADGSKVFFTDRNRLTLDSTAGGDRAHQDLYMFDIEQNRLSDLTIDGNPGGAQVKGVLEASEDGSFVYFVADGALPDTGAVAGHNNLYMWHEGEARFIGILSNNDSGHAGFHEPVVAHDWDSSTGDRTARTTADGQRLLFMSSESLTGYDNRDANTGVPDEEVYLYDATVNRLTCLSCRTDGARPIGPSGFPGGTPWRAVDERGSYQPRVLSADGNRVFFDSYDALSPQDTNSAQDVYEWERAGIGTCKREDGCVTPLTDVTSTGDSSVVDASANGDDVFFITRAELVAQDTDQLRDLYDARVDGGFPAPPQSATLCEGESCLPIASPPRPIGPVASAIFSGVGNLSTISTRLVKVKAKTPKKTKKHKKRTKKTVHGAKVKNLRSSQKRR
jgi:hypothetical protein